MTRIASFALIAGALALAACGGTTDPDAGTDSGNNAPDTGPPPQDSGPIPDSGPPPDGGPTGCTSGCAFVELALGTLHTCARRENGEVWCWGRNQEGELGDNRVRHQNCAPPTSPPVDCSSLAVQVRAGGTGGVAVTDATELSSQGTFSTCMMRESGGVWCWGEEGTPPPGGGMPAYRTSALAIAGFETADHVSNGHHHVCALYESDGHIVCYGYNSDGQVGTGTRMNVPSPGASVLGEGGTGTFLGALEVDAAGFSASTCARTSEGVWCWGTNRDSQLGDATILHDTDQCGAIAADTHDCSNTPVQVGGATPLTDVTQLAFGTRHGCALGTDGAVRCWGDNRAGQGGQPPITSPLTLPTEVTGLGEVTQVSASGRFSCALLADQTVWCWGYNLNGQLGDGVMDHGDPGSTDNCAPSSDESGDCSATPVQVTGVDDALYIDTGGSHACAIRASGDIYCWGYNDNRQLGNGSRDTSYVPVRVTGLPE